ncbi:MAG: hypothetical protein ACKO5R_04940 [Planctomycetaceae bacterium]
MRFLPHLPRRVAMLLLVATALPVGCGRKVEYVAEPEKATAILESVLAAWRDGATCEDLRGRSPPIHVADEQWLRGAKLESFTLGEGRSFGPSTRFEVTLVGPPPIGTKKVVYVVSTQPAISVALGD